MNTMEPKLTQAMEYVEKAQQIMTELGHTKYRICGMVSKQMLHDSEQEVSALLGKLEAAEDALRDLACFMSCGGYNDVGLVEFDPAHYAQKIKETITNDVQQLKSQLTKDQGCVTISRNGYVQELEQQLADAREELATAKCEAEYLATVIHKSEYSDASDWSLCDSVAGVISQIDNMYAGVRMQRDEARAAWYEMQSSFERSRDEVDAMLERAHKAEHKLAEARKEADKWEQLAHNLKRGACKQIEKTLIATAQRDRLAEALQQCREDSVELVTERDRINAIINTFSNQ